MVISTDFIELSSYDILLVLDIFSVHKDNFYSIYHVVSHDCKLIPTEVTYRTHFKDQMPKKMHSNNVSSV